MASLLHDLILINSSASAQSQVRSGIQNQQEVIDVESPVLQSDLPFLAPVEKPVSPIRKRVQKRSAHLTARARAAVPAKMSRPAAMYG